MGGGKHHKHRGDYGYHSNDLSDAGNFTKDQATFFTVAFRGLPSPGAYNDTPGKSPVAFQDINYDQYYVPAVGDTVMPHSPAKFDVLRHV